MDSKFKSTARTKAIWKVVNLSTPILRGSHLSSITGRTCTFVERVSPAPSTNTRTSSCIWSRKSTTKISHRQLCQRWCELRTLQFSSASNQYWSTNSYLPLCSLQNSRSSTWRGSIFTSLAICGWGWRPNYRLLFHGLWDFGFRSSLLWLCWWPTSIWRG